MNGPYGGPSGWNVYVEHSRAQSDSVDRISGSLRDHHNGPSHVCNFLREKFEALEHRTVRDDKSRGHW